MDDQRQVTIYTAGNSTQASLLVDWLEEQGIRAVVLNEALQSGAAEIVGQSVAPTIVVSAGDADVARAIAQAFDRELVEFARDGNSEEAAVVAETLAAWPLCDGCRKPRHTMCDICGTAGSDFPLADMPPAQDTASGDDVADERGPGLLVLCPTCDEPFVPEFLRRCQWCDHDFGEGRDYDTASEVPAMTGLTEGLNHRALGLAAGVLIVLAALAVYFTVIASGY